MIVPILPRPGTASKLFLTGATVGPLVDSIHNQCLLQYDLLPISVDLPAVPSADVTHAHDAVTASASICTSWLIPPLLGVAYVVLGGVLPRLMQNVISVVSQWQSQSSPYDTNNPKLDQSQSLLRQKAFIAVATTALIIKLSDLLQTHALTFPDGTVPTAGWSLGLMLVAALAQWAALDGTAAALLAASITSIGGPLSELPFVAWGAWHYIPSAADYLPLHAVDVAPGGSLDTALSTVLGSGYHDLALSSITGPCYFAVTMDSIALGRWFDAQDDDLVAEGGNNNMIIHV